MSVCNKARSVTRFSRYEWKDECYLVRKMRQKLRTWAFVPSIRTKTSSKIAFFFRGFSTNWRYEWKYEFHPPQNTPPWRPGAAGAEGISSRILVRTRLPVAQIEAKSMTHWPVYPNHIYQWIIAFEFAGGYGSYSSRW